MSCNEPENPPVIGIKGDRLDLIVRQGGTFGPNRVTLTNPDNSPVDLTDISFRGQIRRTPDAAVVAASFSFTIVDASLGIFEFSIPEPQTAILEAGVDECADESLYFYDIEMFSPGGIVTPLFYGECRVFREVTR
jgi:hypothetical protein